MIWLDWTLKGGRVDSECKSNDGDVVQGGDGTPGGVSEGGVDGRLGESNGVGSKGGDGVVGALTVMPLGDLA